MKLSDEAIASSVVEECIEEKVMVESVESSVIEGEKSPEVVVGWKYWEVEESETKLLVVSLNVEEASLVNASIVVVGWCSCEGVVGTSVSEVCKANVVAVDSTVEGIFSEIGFNVVEKVKSVVSTVYPIVVAFSVEISVSNIVSKVDASVVERVESLV
jgi:hypothetical protein